MDRLKANQITREELNKYGLKEWKISLSLNMNDPYLGLCVHKDKTIFLNMHHIDIHPDNEIINTIRHEVAHAIVGPGHGHNDVWKTKAKEIGCDNTLPCSHLDLPAHVIDAIRNGQQVEVVTEEETHVVRTPKFVVRRVQDMCPDCGKIAIEKFTNEFINKNGDTVRLTTLACFHIVTKIVPRGTAFETFISNAWQPHVKACKHEWIKTQCKKCNEFKLYNFQIDGAKASEAGLSLQKGFGIFDDMGLGKTIQALAVVYFHKEYTPTLYVVKSALTFQWFKQILRWLGPDYIAQIIRTSRDVVLPGLKSYIISYDLLRRFPKSELEKIRYRLVILDECQQIKNPDSTRTNEVRNLVRAPHVKVLPLSGTPWKNRGSEFFPVLNMLDPMRFHSFQKFVTEHCDYYQHGKNMKMGGIANPKKFREFVSNIMIRREYNEVMDEFPEINRHKLSIQLDELNQDTYDDATSDFVAWYNQHVIDGTEESINSIELLGKMARMRHITGLAKIGATVSFVEEFIEETERKLVIFVHHKDVAELLERGIREIAGNIPVMRMTADQDDRERYEIEERFNRTPRIIMIASTGACGEGRNFQTCADAVMHERQWNPQNEEQASPGRFRRIGQKSSAINTTYIEAEGTIDEYLDELNETKGFNYHNAMNRSKFASWNESDFAKGLAAKIVSKHRERKTKGKQIKKSITNYARF